MQQSKTKSFLPWCLGILLIGALVQCAGWLKGDQLVFPGVPDILRAFFRLITDRHTYTLILTTLWHLLCVLVLSTLVGGALGLLEGCIPFMRALLSPLMIFMRSIPMIVLVVMIMVITRYDHVPLIASSLVLIPMIAEGICEGVVHIEPELIDVYRMNCGLTPYVLWEVYVPLVAGYARQAYINAVGMGVKMVVSTEYLVQTKNSLGKAIYLSSYFNEYEEIYAYALIMILLVFLVSELPLWIFQHTKRRI